MAAMSFAPDSQPSPAEQAIALAARQLRPVYADEIEGLKRRGQRRRALRRWGAVAVAGLLCLGLGGVSLGWREVEADRFTPRTVSLADGSRIDLDAGASVRLPLAPWRHEARLIRGDAVFDIVHDDTRSFVVQVGSATLTDLGTRFLVQPLSSDKALVAVFDGRVRVAASGGQDTVLDAGQAAIAAEGSIIRTTALSEGEATAWRQGRLVFRDKPLAEVAAILSRYRPEPVEVVSPMIAGLKINGVFHLDDLDGGLRLLERALPVDIHRRGGRVVLLARDRDSARR
jgi:transmembrane sensor